MIHFFPTFSKTAESSPFGKELAALGIDHRIFAGEVIFRYRHRIWLLLLGWPKLAAFALKSAIRSLLLSKPYPDAVVVGSHIEALIFSLIRALLFKRKPAIVLLGFILTTRRSTLINTLRMIYFRLVFSVVDRVICYSSLEAERYSKLFEHSRAEFVFIPYGLHVAGLNDVTSLHKSDRSRQEAYMLSAGRSGRDYATLFRAFSTLDYKLHVVCDSENALHNLETPSNILVLRNCYNDDYVTELRNASCVVIPLAADDISAGQMVLIQAMAFGKPTIITRTPTVEEYVSDGKQSLLVERGNPDELRAAVERLQKDPELAARLSDNATAAYENSFSMRAYVRNIVAKVNEIL